MRDYSRNYTENLFNALIETSRPYINSLVEAAAIVEHSEEFKDVEVVSNQIYNACKILSLNNNAAYLCRDDFIEHPCSIINIKDLMKEIIIECSEMLVPINREIQLVVNCVNLIVKANEKVLTLAITNILQNALLYSPPKSAVIVNITNDLIDSVQYLKISVTNLNKPDSYENESEKHGLGIPLCKKIAERYEGKFEKLDSDENTIINLLLPIDNDGSGLSVCRDFTEYISERFKSPRLYMYEVLSKN